MPGSQKKNKILAIGTAWLSDEEEKARVRLVNLLCLIGGSVIFFIGLVLCHYLHWKAFVVVPLSGEFLLNASVLWWNYKRKFAVAAWLLYLLELHTEIGYIKGSNEHCDAAQDAVSEKLEAAQDALESSFEDNALGLASAGEFLKLAMERLWVGEEEVKAYKERLESED